MFRFNNHTQGAYYDLKIITLAKSNNVLPEDGF
jgi:hypothetical protein